MLADQPTAREGADIIVALAWLSAAAALVIIAFWLIRRWVLRSGEDDGQASGFTLAELRRLHREGDLTDAQFQAAKAALIAHGLAAMGGIDRKPVHSEQNAPDLSDESITSDNDGASDKRTENDPPNGTS